VTLVGALSPSCPRPFTSLFGCALTTTFRSTAPNLAQLCLYQAYPIPRASSGFQYLRTIIEGRLPQNALDSRTLPVLEHQSNLGKFRPKVISRFSSVGVVVPYKTLLHQKHVCIAKAENLEITLERNQDSENEYSGGSQRTVRETHPIAKRIECDVSCTEPLSEGNVAKETRCSAVRSQTESPLLLLPPEIRNAIYAHVLSGHHVCYIEGNLNYLDMWSKILVSPLDSICNPEAARGTCWKSTEHN
jgi:hypothetical protein